MKTLEDVWNFCEEQQSVAKSIMPEEKDKYLQGMITAFKMVQREINQKCSEFDK